MRKTMRIRRVRTSDLEEQYRHLLADHPQAQNDGTLEQPLPEYVKVVDSIATYGACEEPVI